MPRYHTILPGSVQLCVNLYVPLLGNLIHCTLLYYAAYPPSRDLSMSPTCGVDIVLQADEHTRLDILLLLISSGWSATGSSLIAHWATSMILTGSRCLPPPGRRCWRSSNRSKPPGKRCH